MAAENTFEEISNKEGEELNKGTTTIDRKPKEETAVEEKQKNEAKVDNNNNTKMNKDPEIDRRCLLAKRFGVPFYYCMHEQFLMHRLHQLFPLSDLYEFLQSMQTRGPLTIRVNNLKTNPYLLNYELTQRKVSLHPFATWCRNSFVVNSKNLRKGTTPEFLHGHYLVQDISGLLPVMALHPQTTEKILDLCAGIGEKASYIVDKMRNTGRVFVNEINHFHIKSLRVNFCRLGVRNSIITDLDGRKFPLYISDFDRVLVDAPSSGSGIISKEPVFRIKLDENEIERLAKLQKQLLLAGIDCVKVDGIIVYCTNSILPEENECVVEYALKHRKVTLVETNLPIGSEGLTEYMGRYMNPQLSLTRRFYPHLHQMDGSFVAKFKKCA